MLRDNSTVVDTPLSWNNTCAVDALSTNTNDRDPLLRTFHQKRKELHVSVAEYSRRGCNSQCMNLPTGRRPPNSLLHKSWHYGGSVPKPTGHGLEYRACKTLGKSWTDAGVRRPRHTDRLSTPWKLEDFLVESSSYRRWYTVPQHAGIRAMKFSPKEFKVPVPRCMIFGFMTAPVMSDLTQTLLGCHISES